MASKESKTAGPESEGTITKADAARAVLAEGIDSPGKGVAAIKSRYGIEMTRGHFSAEKARYLHKGAQGKLVLKKGRPAGKSAAPKPLVEGYLAPPPTQSQSTEGESDLLNVMEQMKPLVATLGKEQLKRIVDLLG